jgi:hypothetical protein
MPTLSVNMLLSTAKIWEMLITESRGSPEAFLGQKTFPGAAASLKLDVITATTTVRMPLTLNSLD